MALVFAASCCAIYACTKNEQLRKLWIENVPNGSTILDYAVRIENGLKSIDLAAVGSSVTNTTNEALEKINTSIDKVRKGANTAKEGLASMTDAAKSGIDGAVKKATEVKESALKAFDITKKEVVSTKEKVEKTLGDAVERVQAVVGTNTSKNQKSELKSPPVSIPTGKLTKSELLKEASADEEKNTQSDASQVMSGPNSSLVNKSVSKPLDDLKDTDNFVVEAAAIASDIVQVPIILSEPDTVLIVEPPALSVTTTDAGSGVEVDNTESIQDMARLVDKTLSLIEEPGADIKEILEIPGLKSVTERMQPDEVKILLQVLADKGAEIKREMVLLKEESDQALRSEVEKVSTEYEKKIEAELNQTRLEFENMMTSRLDAQADLYLTVAEEDLKTQAELLDKRWADQVKLEVDKERGGRLAKLDQLGLKLMYLERAATMAVEKVSSADKINYLRAAAELLRSKLSQAVNTDFSKEIFAIKALGGNDSFIQLVLDAVEETDSVRKYQTSEELKDWFEDLYPLLWRNQLVPDNAGPFSYIIAQAFSILLLHKRSPTPGTTSDCVLSRAAHHINHGDLDSAAREINQLKGWTKVLARDWLDALRCHLTLNQAIDAIETRLRAQALGLVE